MEDLTGKQFGHYQIVGPLGEGGMAAVYKAYQPAMERYVAVKVLPRHMASSDEFVARFKREAKMLAKLQHPHILSVFDYGESDGYPYIVMPFVQSGTLSESMHGKIVALAEVSRVISQVGAALGYAHVHGMIHRDVKPSNVLIDEGGNCLLTDFGLARMAETSVKLTSSGAVMGTPSYMSPEQGVGGEIDHRSDLYALGVILYEMVTGRVPYSAETPIAVVFKHIQDPLPSARKINPSLPESVELVIFKALAKSPDDRYQTADDFVHAIQEATAGQANEGVTIMPSTSTSTSKPSPSVPLSMRSSKTKISAGQPVQNRSMKFVIGGAVVLFLIIAGVWGMSLVTKQANPTEAAGTLTKPATAAIINPPATEAIVESPTVEPSATLAGPEVLITDPKGVTMALVSAGEFSMGNDIEESLADCIKLYPNDFTAKCKSEYYLDETPTRKVNLDAYYIDQFEVTNAFYEVCVAEGVCAAPIKSSSGTHNAYYGSPEYDNYPVIWVDWSMAKTYCEWRGAHLPSEAQWEKAARGDSQQTYPWGDTFEGSAANSCDVNCQKAFANKIFDDGFEDTAPVVNFPDGASVYDVFNMAGNVSEWVADFYSDSYYTVTGASISNPLGPQDGDQHVLRGGSWARFQINLRVVTRSHNAPDFSAEDLGFRCAMPIP